MGSSSLSPDNATEPQKQFSRYNSVRSFYRYRQTVPTSGKRAKRHGRGSSLYLIPGAKCSCKANDAENQFQNGYLLLSYDALEGTIGAVRRIEHSCRLIVSGM